MMKVLIVGGGGREHALAWKVAQSPRVSHVYVTPGNAGTMREPGIRNVEIAADDIPALLEFSLGQGIDLTIVGPEVPLVAGIVDSFQLAGLRCFGPTRDAARLEGSKVFSKDFLTRHHIATAEYSAFTAIEPAKAWVRDHGVPIVIKADGLAAGKGVVVAQSLAEADQALEDMLGGNRLREAGHRVVIEEFLTGEEASFICMVDGEHILALATSQDHKARDEGDRGPNTGGMGAYSPAPVINDTIHKRIMRDIIRPTVRGMSAEGVPYTGFLYAGLMINAQGRPKVLEFNCRFGDPETQPILLRLRSDLVMLCEAALDGRLHTVDAVWDTRAALGVVLASEGYPGEYRKGDVITGLPENGGLEDTKVFHAGTREEYGDIVTNGGRVLCVTALGGSVTEAQTRAYQVASGIHWDGMFYRNDIGFRAVEREKR